MQKKEACMKTKFHWLVCLALVLSMTFTSIPSAAASACNPAFVAKIGYVITVRATFVDDTANLQCAFDMAVAGRPGMTVRLLRGIYHTGQIVVNNFHGTFTGAGMRFTQLTNLPNLYVTPVDVIVNPPSASNPWPALISFVEGDVTVSNLAFQIKGENATQGWSVFGSPPIIELSSAVLFIGGKVNARVARVLVEGEPMENSIMGYSLINGIYYESYYSDTLPTISGTFTVSDSIFRNVGSGTPLEGLSNASVLITRNTFKDVILSMDAADLINSRLVFSFNSVDAQIGLDLYNAFFSETTGSSFLIKNNVFTGSTGIAVEPVFGAGNKCMLTGNNVQNVTDVGVYLGPGTRGCMVIGDRHKTTVLDEGIDNILINVIKITGSGVGSAIQRFLK
jgi:hypothetical protein